MPVSVLIIGSRDTRLEEVLRASGRIASITWGSDLQALLEPHAVQPDVLLVDVRRATQLPSALADLKRQRPAMNIMLLASGLDPALMLQGMRAGVNEIVADPLSQAEFDAAITRLLGQRTHAAAGPVFAFVGAKGGVGTTTTAVNVATALAKLSPAGALLMDLHLAYGDAAVFLGVDARFSVLDALENFHRLDAAFLKSLVVHTPSGLDLLASAERPAARPIELGASARSSSSRPRSMDSRSSMFRVRIWGFSTAWITPRASWSSRTRSWRRCGMPVGWPLPFAHATRRPKCRP